MRSFLATLGLLALAGCHNCGHEDVGGGGDLVGGACHDDFDCVEECLGGPDFPDGTCSVPCGDDHDCPDGTVCIDKMGGQCLLACHHDSTCRGAYQCKSEDRKGAGGKLEVCIH